MATEFTLENVQSVYSGKHGCMCGCNGKHTYAEACRGRGNEIRGYEIDEDEISERSVKIIFNKVFGGKLGEAKPNGKWPSTVAAIMGGEKIWFVETETRVLVVYFK